MCARRNCAFHYVTDVLQRRSEVWELRCKLELRAEARQTFVCRTVKIWLLHHRNLCANVTEPDWLMPFGDVELFIVSNVLSGEDVRVVAYS